MEYEEALTALVSKGDAIAELANHGVKAASRIGFLVDTETDEIIATPKACGDFSGADVLAFLGY